MHALTLNRILAARPDWNGPQRHVWLKNHHLTDEERLRYTGVYFMASGGFIKAGMAADVEVRFCEINKMLPVAAERIAWIHLPLKHDDLYHKEHVIHRRLKRWHVRGEWFKDCQEVRQFIAKYGKPWPNA